ncbi:TIGR00266 family protein [Thermodesulfovibrionales bacterium]|nr:TIGR00266 family protein [Thermodesulfovibrionales bacterium]
MEHEIFYRPSFSLLKIKLRADESIQAEAGAMVSMSSAVQIKTQAKGGFLGALKRSALGGESFFLNTFSAPRGGEILLAPSLPGDISHLGLKGKTVFVQSGSYIASSPAVTIDTKWGGAKTFFSGEGLFLLKLSGEGELFISSFGAIHEIDLKANEPYIVDTGHMVAFDESVSYAVKKVGGLKSTLFSGEGLVCELTGPGRILIQTRSEDAFLSWLIPKMPSRG